MFNFNYNSYWIGMLLCNCVSKPLFSEDKVHFIGASREIKNVHEKKKWFSSTNAKQVKYAIFKWIKTCEFFL